MSFRVSTYVMIGECNSKFDIDCIYDYLHIDEDVSRIRFNNQEKSIDGIKPCKTFFNQISIYISDGLCIKLFSNGKFQISGSKTEAHALSKIKMLIGKMKKIGGEKKIEVIFKDGFPTYNDKVLIKGENYYTTKFSYKNKEFHVNDSVYLKCELTGLLIEKFHNEKVKRVLDTQMNMVGTARYDMFRKGKNLCLKHMGYVKLKPFQYEIRNEKFDVPYGTLTFDLFTEPLTDDTKDSVILSYKAINSDTEIVNFSIANLNSSMKLEVKGSLDRTSIFEKLLDMGFEVDFNPAKFPGIKFTHDSDKVTIFRTGSIILASTKYPQKTIDFIKEFFKEDFTMNKSSLEVDTSKTLTIWDLFD